MAVLSTIGDGLWAAFQMAWEVAWALVLGFALSGIVQAWVPRSRIERALGGRGPREIARATGLGAASSSCSYAAIAIAKSMFAKGASFASAMAFQFASTNLVFELGIVIWVFIGWQFTLAELVGGLILIALRWLGRRDFVRRRDRVHLRRPPDHPDRDRLHEVLRPRPDGAARRDHVRGDRAGRAHGRRDLQRGGARANDAAIDRLDHESGHLLELHDLPEHRLFRGGRRPARPDVATRREGSRLRDDGRSPGRKTDLDLRGPHLLLLQRGLQGEVRRRARALRRRHRPAGDRARACRPQALAVVRPPAQPLRLAAPALLLASPPLGRGRRPGRPALPLYLQRLAQGLDQTLGRELAVSPLAAFVLGDGAEHRAGLRSHPPLLGVGQTDRALDAEHRLGPRLGLLRVLPAGAARAREAKP